MPLGWFFQPRGFHVFDGPLYPSYRECLEEENTNPFGEHSARHRFADANLKVALPVLRNEGE